MGWRERIERDSLLSWFKRLICGDLQYKYEASQRRVSQLETQVEIQKHISNAFQKISESCEILKESYKRENEALAELLDKAFKIPVFPDYVDYGEWVNPWNHSTLQPYLKEVWDAQYIALPKEKWDTLLQCTYTSIKKTLGKWQVEIFDCDNFANVFNAMISLIARDSGFDNQLAFALARSRIHAYNIYVDDAGAVWVFEPQSGKTVDKLTLTEEPYDTIRVYFLN